MAASLFMIDLWSRLAECKHEWLQLTTHKVLHLLADLANANLYRGPGNCSTRAHSVRFLQLHFAYLSEEPLKFEPFSNQII